MPTTMYHCIIVRLRSLLSSFSNEACVGDVVWPGASYGHFGFAAGAGFYVWLGSQT